MIESGASFILSGQEFRSIADRNEVSFYVSSAIDSPTGVAVMGFSGESGVTDFLFQSGKIFDPENRFASSYRQNENFQISGNISGAKYDYYINGMPICYNGQRTESKLQRFFVHTTGCNFNMEKIDVRTKPFEYDLNFTTGFIVSGLITGILESADGTSNFKIFSGELSSGTSGMFGISGINKADTTSATISIHTTGKTLDESGVAAYEDHVLKLKLFTNFGEVEKEFTTSSIPETTLTTTFNLEDVINTDYLLSGSRTSSGILNLFYRLVEEEDFQIKNKPLNIFFDYEGGKTGQFHTVSTSSLTYSGSGYKTTPTGIVTGTDEIMAAQIKPLMSFVVTGVDVTYSGSGYTSAPTVSITGGSGSNAAATAVIYTSGTYSGMLSGVTMTNSGSNYTGVPVVTFTSTIGTTGSGVAGLGEGTMTGTNIEYAGGYHLLAPDFSGISGGGIDGKLTSITVAHSGSGYVSNPTVLLSGATGQTEIVASGLIETSGQYSGLVTGIHIANQGFRYNATPAMSFSGDLYSGGFDATGHAVMDGTIANMSITTTDYYKSFTGYWRLATGVNLPNLVDYYLNNHIDRPALTGYLNVDTGIYVTGESFDTAISILDTYPDSGQMLGKLTLSGMNDTKIEKIITGRM